MKRLGLYVFIVATLFSLTLVFSSPEKVFAEATTTPASPTTLVGGITKDQVIAILNGYFAASLTAVDASVEANKLVLGENTQAYKDYVSTIPAIKDTISRAQTLYNTAIKTTYATGDYSTYNLKDANDLAVNDAANFINQQKANTPALQTSVASLPLTTLVDTISNTTKQFFDFSTKAISTGTNGGTDNANAALTASTAAAVEKITEKSSLSNQCSLFPTSNIPACIDDAFVWIIRHTLLNIAGVLLWMASSLLNLAVKIGILGFAGWAPPTLYALWIIVRQIVSLFVVFAGLYLGFMYIIGKEDTFGKYIGWLTLFALFVNFSYPLTRGLIDISNVISLNVYASAIGTDPLTTTDVIGGNGAGSLIMQRLGITNLIGQAETQDTGLIGNANTTPGALLTVAYVLYTTYILVMATGIILFRTAVLVFLTIVSPILFVDSVVPGLGEEAKKLRKMFLDQLFVAPVFMIMLALTLKFLEVFQSGPLKASTTVVSSAQGIQNFFNIFLMLIMLHIMLKVTKTVGGSMSELAMSGMGKLTGASLGVAAGGVGMGLRGTAGLAAARLRDSTWMDKQQGTRTGRGLYSMANSLATNTFDAKNIPIANNGLIKKGLTMAGVDINLGTGTKKTYDTTYKTKEETTVKKYNSIKDGEARKQFIEQKTGSIFSNTQKVGLRAVLPGLDKNDPKSNAHLSDNQIIAKKIIKDEDKAIERYKSIKDLDRKREYLETLPVNVQQQIKEMESKGEIASTEGKIDGVTATEEGAFEKKKWSDYDTPAVFRKNKSNEDEQKGEDANADWVGKDTNIPAAQRKAKAAQNADTELELEPIAQEGAQTSPALRDVGNQSPKREETSEEINQKLPNGSTEEEYQETVMQNTSPVVTRQNIRGESFRQKAQQLDKNFADKNIPKANVVIPKGGITRSEEALAA